MVAQMGSLCQGSLHKIRSRRVPKVLLPAEHTQVCEYPLFNLAFTLPPKGRFLFLWRIDIDASALYSDSRCLVSRNATEIARSNAHH
jgi:hypothetical protein